MTIPSGSIAVESLWGALVEEIHLQKELAAILDREHRFLTAMSLEGLLPIEADKASALERIRSNAQKIQNCMTNLAAIGTLTEGENITLSRLVALLEEPERIRLWTTQEQLIAWAGQVREQNRVNERLLHGSLAYLSHYLNLLRMLAGGPTGYLANGAVPEQQQSGRILALKG